MKEVLDKNDAEMPSILQWPQEPAEQIKAECQEDCPEDCIKTSDAYILKRWKDEPELCKRPLCNLGRGCYVIEERSTYYRTEQDPLLPHLRWRMSEKEVEQEGWKLFGITADQRGRLGWCITLFILSLALTSHTIAITALEFCTDVTSWKSNNTV